MRLNTDLLQRHVKSKVKYTDIAVRSLTCRTATETHVPYTIPQCYLPPDRFDIPVYIFDNVYLEIVHEPFFL